MLDTGKKLAGLSAALALFGLASAPVSAGTINFTFFGGGTVDSVHSCGDSCYELATSGGAVATGGLDGPGAWEFNGILRFDSLSDRTGSAVGSNWKFDDLLGGNDLWGTFTSDMDRGFLLLDLDKFFADLALGVGSLTYTITGGSGIFLDAIGEGASEIGYAGFAYLENGWMQAITPDSPSVPEPATMALLATGMGLFGLNAWRRRRQTQQP